VDEPISAADANRKFSQILRGVREERATYVVTSHGKPVAKIVPFDAGSNVSTRARETLLARLKSEPLVHAGHWKREELYERGK
jgi:prevent-host-death family protein